jgi:tetratricopeptide (TPR) repeat protein
MSAEDKQESANQGDAAGNDRQPLSREEQDRRLASELSRRGVPPEEIERLLALGQPAAAVPGPPPKAASVIPVPPVPPPAEPYEPKPAIALPDFRESTPQERMEADRLLTAANIARRRGNFQEAEKACRQAIELVPDDAAALELYGDIFQAVGRVDDALYSYQRAHEADPKRQSAEKKYAELMLLQNREIEALREEYIPRNPNVAILFSALFPGAGQVYNGKPLKGFFIALAMLVCVLVLGWTPLGFPHRQQNIPFSLVLFLILAGAVYIYAVVDANLSARQGRRTKSGWEV